MNAVEPIVLDNCEHFIDTAALLAERLLRGAPSVHIIATSRESLRAKSERVLRLAPLELPPPGGGLCSPQLRRSASRRSNCLRSAPLDTFELHDAEVPIVAGICHPHVAGGAGSIGSHNRLTRSARKCNEKARRATRESSDRSLRHRNCARDTTSLVSAAFLMSK